MVNMTLKNCIWEKNTIQPNNNDSFKYERTELAFLLSTFLNFLSVFKSVHRSCS